MMWGRAILHYAGAAAALRRFFAERCMPNYYLPGVTQIPSSLLITGITQSAPMIVSVSVPSDASNTYVPGQLVRLTVPRTWGMWQADKLTGKILSTGVGTITLNIDSSNFDPFVDGSSSSEAPASLAPSGSQNYQFSNASRQVPFQSLNNIGN